MPYSGCDDIVTLLTIRAGKRPQRPSHGIPDPVWQLLEECWSRDPQERPSVTQVYNILSKFRSVRPAIEELPGKLTLQVQGIKISPTRGMGQQFSVKLKYGDNCHTTSLTTITIGDDEYAWFAFRPSLSTLPSLSPGQEQPRNLADRNRRTVSLPGGLLQSVL